MEELFHYLRALVEKNGPDKADYHKLNSWMDKIIAGREKGDLPKSEIDRIRSLTGDAFTVATCQGFALCKPHGYAGDYEMLDRLYTKYVSPEPRLKKWDRYYHHHAAARAVRNRCAYLRRVIKAHGAGRRPVTVLNLGSGPGRDMRAWFVSANGTAGARVSFECVDHDQAAIEHARRVCRGYLRHITFTRENILRFKPPAGRYDVIWSSGVFDYFNDRIFARVLSRLLPGLREKGEIVIGNFSEANPTRSYMEMLEWHLKYRTPARLKAIARGCGVADKNIAVGQDPTGVNLFLHIRK